MLLGGRNGTVVLIDFANQFFLVPQEIGAGGQRREKPIVGTVLGAPAWRIEGTGAQILDFERRLIEE